MYYARRPVTSKSSFEQDDDDGDDDDDYCFERSHKRENEQGKRLKATKLYVNANKQQSLYRHRRPPPNYSVFLFPHSKIKQIKSKSKCYIKVVHIHIHSHLQLQITRESNFKGTKSEKACRK